MKPDKRERCLNGLEDFIIIRKESKPARRERCPNSLRDFMRRVRGLSSEKRCLNGLRDFMRISQG